MFSHYDMGGHRQIPLLTVHARLVLLYVMPFPAPKGGFHLQDMMKFMI